MGLAPSGRFPAQVAVIIPRPVRSMGQRRSGSEQESARRPGERLAVGRIVRPHGIRGAMVVSAYSDILRGLDQGAEVQLEGRLSPFHLGSCRSSRGRLLLELTECEDRDGAEALRGLEIYVPVGSVPPLPTGTYYQWQILGLHVVTDSSEALGNVVEILETGANDVYVVRGEGGQEMLLPAIEDVIKKVDLEGGTMVVVLLPGLLHPE